MSYINNVVFIVGPSGIGKSSVIKHISENFNASTYILDQLVYEAAIKHSLIVDGGAYQVLKKLGNKAFFILGMNYLFQKINNSLDKKSVIDVGAAFQNIELLQSYSSLYNVILIGSSPKVSYERYISNRPKDPRGFFNHCAIEYSPTRIKLYDSATYKIDTTELTLFESASKLNDILKAIWDE